MSDTQRPVDDYSRPTDRYREDFTNFTVDGTENPIERISKIRVPGVFHIHKKNTASAVSPQMKELLKPNDGSKKPKVGVEVGFGPNKKEIMEMNQKLQRLGLLASQAGIEIDVDGSGKMIVELPPELQGDKKELEKVRAQKEILEKRAPLVSRYARLCGRATTLLNNSTSTLEEKQKNELNDKITSLEWLLTETFEEMKMTNEEVGGSLSQLETLIRKNEASLSLKKDQELQQLIEKNKRERKEQQEALLAAMELSDLYVSFAELQRAITEVLSLVSDKTLRKEIEEKRGYLLSIKEKVRGEALPTAALVEEFKIAIKNEEREIEKIVEDIKIKKERVVAIEPTKKIVSPKEVKQLEKDKKEELLLLFDKYKEKNDELEALKNSFFGELTSLLEKDMITRRFNQLTHTSQEAERSLAAGNASATEIIKEYGEELTSVGSILTMVKERLEKMYSRAVYSLPTSPSPLNSLTKKVVALRPSSRINQAVTLRDGTKIATVPLQRTQQAKPLQKEIKSLRDVAEKREATDIFKLHEELFKKNNEEYLKIYLKKDWEYGDPNKEAVEKVIENYKNSLLRKNKVITFKINTKERELSKTEELSKRTLIQIEINELQKEIERNTEETKKIGEKINTLSNDIVLRHTKEKENNSRSLIGSRKVYDPSTDASTFDIGRNRQDLTLDERAKFDAAIKSREFEGQKSMTDKELRAMREGVSVATDRVVPHHYQGMVTPVQLKNGVGEASYIEKKFAGATSQPSPKTSSLSSSPTTNQEKTRLKSARVEKLFNAITSLNTTKYGIKNWHVFAVAAVALFGAGYFGASAYDNREGKEKTPQTLGQAVSWKDFPELDQLKAFITDLV